MNRLTKKDKDHIGGYATNGTYDIGWKSNAFEKLGQYEDIEELCEKIKTQTVYQKIYKDNNNYYITEETFFDCSILYNFEKKCIEIYQYEWVDGLKLEHYGIEWSFNKEELEK